MPAFRPRLVVIHPEVQRAYESIESAAGRGENPVVRVWKSFQRVLNLVKNDGLWGEVIRTIPRYFVEKYSAKNLYCVDLTRFHGAFYTIKERDIVFLDLVDHKTYDKWFPGKRR